MSCRSRRAWREGPRPRPGPRRPCADESWPGAPPWPPRAAPAAAGACHARPPSAARAVKCGMRSWQRAPWCGAGVTGNIPLGGASRGRSFAWTAPPPRWRTESSPCRAAGSRPAVQPCSASVHWPWGGERRKRGRTAGNVSQGDGPCQAGGCAGRVSQPPVMPHRLGVLLPRLSLCLATHVCREQRWRRRGGLIEAAARPGLRLGIGRPRRLCLLEGAWVGRESEQTALRLESRRKDNGFTAH